jgi:hypothetical protein
MGIALGLSKHGVEDHKAEAFVHTSTSTVSGFRFHLLLFSLTIFPM